MRFAKSECTVMGRASLSITMPSLARSQSFLPPTFKAETIGGICMISPRNFSSTDSTSLSEGIRASQRTRLPVISSVSEVSPRRRVAI